MRIHTGNGGGCGKPELRDKSLIEEDLLNEYITLDQAKNFINTSSLNFKNWIFYFFEFISIPRPILFDASNLPFFFVRNP